MSALINLLSKLPFWILYLLSDILYLVLYYIIRYRKEVVYENLRHSFPDHTEAEITEIAKNFYHFFSDLIVETLKFLSIEETKLLERITVDPRSIEVAERYYNEGRTVIMMAGHYANWEWMAVVPRYTRYQVLITYKILSNPFFEKLTKRIRERFGAQAVDHRQVYKVITKLERQGIQTATWICGDQSPKLDTNDRSTLYFLNQDTRFFSGAEKLARKKNAVVFFCKLQRTARGFYTVNFEMITDDPKSLPEGEIIQRYANKIEALIRQAPAFWLWSHKRWKKR